MRPLLFILPVVSLILHGQVYGCTCGDYDETFFETYITADNLPNNREYIVMAAVKLDNYHHGMHVRVIEVIYKKAMEDINEADTVIVWGGECRQSTEDVSIGDTTIFTLFRTDLFQNEIFPPDDPRDTDIEQEEDLMTPFCGMYKLGLQNGKVLGDITGHHTEMEYGRFKEAIQEKQIPLSIEPSGHAAITIYPNPANDQINIHLPKDAIGYTTAYFLDNSGKVHPADLCYSMQKRTLSTRHLSNGLYFLVLVSEGRIVRRKIQIHHY